MSINKFLQPAGNWGAPMDNGNTGAVTLRDYQHAARIFTDADYRLSPKYGFLFYVEFDLNPLITNLNGPTSTGANGSPNSQQEMGMVVKTVSLPKFSVQVKEHNAYNRKNYVQNSIKYDPVTITFHDDQSDVIRNFWYDYYSFYYRDPDYADATYTAPHKYQDRPSFDWGYSPQARVGYNNANGNQPYQYIQAIRIYSLYQKNFSEYELINPIITRFEHGEHQQGNEGGLLQHSMSLQFETVKYYTGYTTTSTAGGYIDLHYDNQPSPISPLEGTDLIDNGIGGYTHAPNKQVDLAGVNLNNTTFGTLIQNNSIPIVNTGAAAMNAATTFSVANGGTNGGGFSIPNLGSLNNGGITTSGLLNQTSTAIASTAGQLTSTFTNSVVGGLKSSVGAGTVALAAAAISNPKLLVTTAENLAVGVATSYASQQAQTLLTPLLKSAGSFVASEVSEGLSYLNSAAGSVFAGAGYGTTLTGEIQNVASSALNSIKDAITGQDFSLGP